MTACGYCFTCLEYCSKNMECCARLNTRITKPYEAQEKGQQLGKTEDLLVFELNRTLTRAAMLLFNTSTVYSKTVNDP